MLINLLRAALEARQLFIFNYDGMVRKVEPHALGLNKKGEVVCRGYQVGGDSASNAEGWKLFVLERATQIEIVDGDSMAPRPGYKQGDTAMREIFAELPAPEPTAVAA